MALLMALFLTLQMSQYIVFTTYFSPSFWSIVGFVSACAFHMSGSYGSVLRKPYDDFVILCGPFSLSNARRTAPTATALSLEII